MFPRMRWPAAAVAWYFLLILLHARSEVLFGARTAGGTVFQWVYGAGFYLLGVVLIGALARLRPDWAPALRRASTILVGAALAGIDGQLHAPAMGVTCLELWMSALLGLALAALSARLAPRVLVRGRAEGRGPGN